MPIAFGSFTGKRGLGASGGGEEEEVLIQPTNVKMVLVAGGGAAGPQGDSQGVEGDPWYVMAENTPTVLSLGDKTIRRRYWPGYARVTPGYSVNGLISGFANSTSNSYGYATIVGNVPWSPLLFPGDYYDGGAGGGGSGEVKYCNIANVYATATYSVVVGTGGTWNVTPSTTYVGEPGGDTTLNAPAPVVPGGLSITAYGGGGGGAGGLTPVLRNLHNFPSTAGLASNAPGAAGGSGGGAGGDRLDIKQLYDWVGTDVGDDQRDGGQTNRSDVNAPSTGQFLGCGGIGGGGKNTKYAFSGGGGGGASGRGQRNTNHDGGDFGSAVSIYSAHLSVGAVTATTSDNVRDNTTVFGGTAYVNNVFYNLGMVSNGAGHQFDNFNKSGKESAYINVTADGRCGVGLFARGSITPSNYDGFEEQMRYDRFGNYGGQGGDGFSLNFVFQYYGRDIDIANNSHTEFGADINWGSPPNIQSGIAHPSFPSYPYGVGASNGRLAPSFPATRPYLPSPMSTPSPALRNHGYFYGVVAGGGGGNYSHAHRNDDLKYGTPSYDGTGWNADTTFPGQLVPGSPSRSGTSPSSSPQLSVKGGLGAEDGVPAVNNLREVGAGGTHLTYEQNEGSGMQGCFFMQHSDANAIATCTGNPTIFKHGGNVYYIFRDSGTFYWANTIPE